jgi:hypothetical protein
MVSSFSRKAKLILYFAGVCICLLSLNGHPEQCIGRQDAGSLRPTSTPDFFDGQFTGFSTEVNGFHGENYKRLANLNNAL